MGENIDLKDEKGILSFASYPSINRKVETLLTTLKNNIETIIVNGVNSQWTLANNKNNELSRRVFGDNVGKLTKAQERRYFSNNDNARDAFLKRKENGMNLSDRVWDLKESFKEELEMGLDVSIRNGVPASETARELNRYLNRPDMLFRRVRDEHGELQLSKKAKAYHPGMGVYRSSYKNALRLTATETNIAYRTADYERYKDLDFVVGIEIHLSGNHTLNGVPFTDICDQLKGKYPKDFKFIGWHPNCRCYVTSILKTQAEMERDNTRILAGEEPLPDSENEVKDVPKGFNDWVEKNGEKVQARKSKPYFFEDNKKYVEEALQKAKTQGEYAEKEPTREDFDNLFLVKDDIKNKYGEPSQEHFQKSLEENIDTLVEPTSKAWKDADEETKEAFKIYLGPDYRYINGLKYDYDNYSKKEFKIHSITEYKQFGNKMEDFISKCNSTKDMILERGTKYGEIEGIFGKDVLEKIQQDIKDGKKVWGLKGIDGVQKGFISTSYNKNGGFAKDADVRISIFAPKGTEVSYTQGIGYDLDYDIKWNGKITKDDITKLRVNGENEMTINCGYRMQLLGYEQSLNEESNKQIHLFIKLLERKR